MLPTGERWSVGPSAVTLLFVSSERREHGVGQDGEWEGSRWVYDAEADDELRRRYVAIPVDHCIYCRSQEVACSFVFLQPHSLGLRLAVPGHIGLCERCLALLNAGDFQAVLRRTRDTELDYFPDDHVLALIRASRDALLSS
jgi:hypothetical protein